MDEFEALLEAERVSVWSRLMSGSKVKCLFQQNLTVRAVEDVVTARNA